MALQLSRVEWTMGNLFFFLLSAGFSFSNPIAVSQEFIEVVQIDIETVVPNLIEKKKNPDHKLSLKKKTRDNRQLFIYSDWLINFSTNENVWKSYFIEKSK